MFELELSILILLIIALVAACAFEFVNGFHDTANAVATVIYTNSLKPWIAVVWSGICNFIGVFAGGIGVAMGIVNLLPVDLLIDQNVYHSIAMILALLLSAIFWNLGTWYLGLPASSSHTLIGSILGVGVGYSFLPEATGAAVNWDKATDIGMSLLFSPLVGFGVAALLLLLIKRLIRNPKLYQEPELNTPPPTGIRALLIGTCTLVSFFHGSNDGQKGVGLVMLILIAVIPVHFALNNRVDFKLVEKPLTELNSSINKINQADLNDAEKEKLEKVKKSVSEALTVLGNPGNYQAQGRIVIRKDILTINRNLKSLMENPMKSTPASEIATIQSSSKAIKNYTDYAPTWVVFMISVSLGLGTMVGWKRIVKTIGEKIGKTHMSYAQGACAELVAASTIGLSTAYSLPVSTTHVLSSGVAGTMVANNGVKNLQGNTVRNILLAWVLTLPVTMTLSGSMFLLFRSLF
jgi:phosphate/sulfate permease